MKNGAEFWFVQIYPNSVSQQDLEETVLIANGSGYPIPKIRPFFKKDNTKGIEALFLGEMRLSDLLDGEAQYQICEKLMDHLKPKAYAMRLAKITQPEHVMPPSAWEIIKKYPELHQTSVIHGDLHPGNILVKDQRPYIVDWDLCGAGPFWYDLLSLLSHPDLCFSKQKRFFLFQKKCPKISEEELIMLFSQFCKFKSIQLNHALPKHMEYCNLARRYAEQIPLFVVGLETSIA